MTALVETFPDWLRELNRVVGSSQQQVASFAPPADLVEDEEGITVHLDVPGVRPEDLEIELENDVLVVRGQRPFPYRGEGAPQGVVRRTERGFGRFERSLRVPQGLDPNAVQASLRDGVLTLRIPKPEQLKPHRIEVKAQDSGQSPQIEGSPGPS
jgi:HSP20 family protein